MQAQVLPLLSGPVAPSPSAPSSPAPTAAPRPVDVLTGLLGYASLGLAAGLGFGEVGVGVRAIPSLAVVGIGALLLTGPALVVGHQYLRLAARPEQLVAAITRGFESAGRVALGLTPVMLFFSATSGLAAPLVMLIACGLGAFGLVSTARALDAAEPVTSDLLARLRMRVLVAGWAGLTLLIALRIAWDVAWFVVGADV